MPFSTSVFFSERSRPSTHGDDDANDSSGDSRIRKRGENRASPKAAAGE